SFAAGRFRVGPLSMGDWLVSAGGGMFSTDFVRVQAGASDVELHVLPRIAGMGRIDGGGGGLEVGTMGEGGASSWRNGEEREFTWQLGAGKYVFLARDAAGDAGLAVVTVGPLPQDVQLHVEPAASCTFVHRARSGTRTLRLLADDMQLPLTVETADP